MSLFYHYTNLPTYVPTYLPTLLPTCVRTYVPTYVPTYLPTYLRLQGLSQASGQGQQDLLQARAVSELEAVQVQPLQQGVNPRGDACE